MGKCYHCNLSLKKKTYNSNINNKSYVMCCYGCLAVFNFIMEAGFADYYKNRENPANTVTELINDSINHQNIFNEKKTVAKFVNQTSDIANITLAIDGISCSACTWLIERHLNKNKYIQKVYINLASCKANIIWNIKELPLNSLLNEFKKIGYNASPYKLRDQEKFYKNEHQRELKNLIISGLGMMQVMMLSFSLYIAEFSDINFYYWSFIRWVTFIITTPVLFISGKKILLNALRSFKNKSLGMDFTISISLILAYISSLKNLIYNTGHVYFDSICMFIFFLLIARFLEMRTRHHTADIINSLQELTSETARIKLKTGLEKYIPIEDVKVNDTILVKPGEIIPLDGIIIQGISYVDESMITGEFKPISKSIGNNVIGGTTNIENYIIINITNTIETSSLSFIIKLLEKINIEKTSSDTITNVVAKYFVLGVLIVTFLSASFWLYIGHDNIMNIILSMLAITCPCALSLATPTAFITAINTLSKNGFMVAKENLLTDLHKTTDIIFDKTGTLTINKYFIKDIKLFRNISVKKMLSLTFETEKTSNHPIAKAFTITNKKYLHLIKDLIIKNNINQGLESIFNKKIYKLGSIIYIKRFILNDLTFINDAKNFLVILADTDGLIAYFRLINPLRKNSIICIKKLKTLNLKIHLLTGDASNKVLAITKKLNINFSKQNCSVKDKVDYITNIQNNGSYVMMIGDGINDVPALSKANISIAMGSGSDLAKINADVILLNNNLTTIYKSIKHSFTTQKIINQNILWAIIYNVTGLSIAACDLITPYYAAVGMSLSSLLVVFNSLRLNKM
ncbi:MAG TPA: heavy metal translocating P-type ATPase [Candidatus Azoamicus sp. OHIO2]